MYRYRHSSSSLTCICNCSHIALDSFCFILHPLSWFSRTQQLPLGSQLINDFSIKYKPTPLANARISTSPIQTLSLHQSPKKGHKPSKWASSIGTTVPLSCQPGHHLVAINLLALTRSAHDQTRASVAAASQSPSLVVAVASTMPLALHSLDSEAATAAAPASLETVCSSSTSGKRVGLLTSLATN